MEGYRLQVQGGPEKTGGPSRANAARTRGEEMAARGSTQNPNSSIPRSASPYLRAAQPKGMGHISPALSRLVEMLAAVPEAGGERLALQTLLPRPQLPLPNCSG